MSKTSVKERNKAIRLAWEREQQLVREGKGTRDWTMEQQADILNPDKGKAYDDLGRTFIGQHMKSAAKYPEYQGNPNNIQFLTYDEHLEAHKGNWKNPTNWYYDPIKKVFHDFGDGELVPCKIINLSNSIVGIETSEIKDKALGEGVKVKVEDRTVPLLKKRCAGRGFSILEKIQEKKQEVKKLEAPKNSSKRKTIIAEEL